MTTVYRHPIAVRLAQVVGITTSAFLSGGLCTISFLAVPPFHLSPAPILARQWREIYCLGKRVAPWMGLIGGLSFMYLAKDASQNVLRQSPLSFELELYTAAAILIPSFIPFTLATMRGLNDELLQAAADSIMGEEKHVRQLVNRWKWLNLVRGVLVGLGSLAGAVAVVNL